MAKKSDRANEIFTSLCENFTQEKLLKRFPTVREIRLSFRCGQGIATEALEMLAEHFHFQRKKGKEKPTMDFSRFNSWNHFLRRKKGCIIAFPKVLSFSWTPLIEQFNRTHKHQLIPKAIINSDEYINEIIAENSADLLILPNHPFILGINRGLKNFIDLEPLTAGIPKEDYYSTMFLKDFQGTIRGIAPALVPKIFYCSKRYQEALSGMHNFSDLPGTLKKIRNRYPEIIYPAVFDSYLHFLCGWGVDLSVQSDFTDYDSWCSGIEFLKKLIQDRLIPPVSELIDYGFSMFFSGQTAMMEAFLVSIPDENPNNKYFIRPRLCNDHVPYAVSSEVLTICEGSAQYEQAWDFIQFTLSARIQQMLVCRMNAFSVLKNLKPIKMSHSVFELFRPILENARRDPYENWLTPKRFHCLEFQIERLIKYGGSIKRFLADLKRERNMISEER